MADGRWSMVDGGWGAVLGVGSAGSLPAPRVHDPWSMVYGQWGNRTPNVERPTSNVEPKGGHGSVTIWTRLSRPFRGFVAIWSELKSSRNFHGLFFRNGVLSGLVIWRDGMVDGRWSMVDGGWGAVLVLGVGCWVLVGERISGANHGGTEEALPISDLGFRIADWGDSPRRHGGHGEKRKGRSG